MKSPNSKAVLADPEFAFGDAPLKVTMMVCRLLLNPNALQLIWQPLLVVEKPSTSATSPLLSTATLKVPAFEPTTVFMNIAVPINWNVRLSPAEVAFIDVSSHELDWAQLDPE